MPLYEFICAGCQEEFEILIRQQSDKKTLSCPKCHSRKVKQQFSVFGLINRDKSNDQPFSSNSTSSCTSCPNHSCANYGG